MKNFHFIQMGFYIPGHEMNGEEGRAAMAKKVVAQLKKGQKGNFRL